MRPHFSRRGHLRRRRDERGASAVEFLILAPVLFFAFTTLVQFGINAHAARATEAAAREGAVAAARFDGTNDAGSRTAKAYLADGEPAINGSQVSTNRGGTEATVTVTVNVVSLMPLLDDPITKTATVPVERFVETSGEFKNPEGLIDAD